MEQFLIMVDDWYDELSVELRAARTNKAQIALGGVLDHLAKSKRLIALALKAEKEVTRVVEPVRWVRDETTMAS